jgi:putative FmdB family regulatory protein
VPTYQYACTECDHSFEQFQRFDDDALTVCPQCAGRLRKVFNAVGVVFKGSGFYRTDSRSAGADGKTAAKTGEAASGDGSSGSATPEKNGSGKNGSKSDSPTTRTPASTGSSGSTNAA